VQLGSFGVAQSVEEVGGPPVDVGRPVVRLRRPAERERGLLDRLVGEARRAR